MTSRKPATERAFLRPTDVAALCECDQRTVHDWAEAGLLVGWKTPGNHRRFTRDAVVSFLVAQGYPVPEWLQP